MNPIFSRHVRRVPLIMTGLSLSGRRRKVQKEGWSYLHAQNDLTTVGWRALYERNVKNEDDKAVLYDIYQR